MNLKYCLLLLLCLYLKAAEAHITPLKTGDHLTGNYSFSVINAHSKTLHLASYRGKFIILDFWATTCTSCIGHFPVMDSLQRKYGDKLAIILVNSASVQEDSIKIAKFYTRYKSRNKGGFILPSIIHDTILEQLFPHALIPHSIWIEPDGKVASITDAEEITDAHVQDFIKGRLQAMPQKEDRFDFDQSLPFGASAPALYESVLTGPMEGLSGRTGYLGEDRARATKIYTINLDIKRLFIQAWLQNGFYPANRVKMDIADSGIYSYSLTMPAGSLQSFYQQMQEDLRRYFRVNVRLDTLETPCWVLQQAEKPAAVNYPDTSYNTLHEPVTGEYTIQGQGVAVLLEKLNEIYDLPVVDETPPGTKLHLQLPHNLSAMPAMQEALLRQGFSIQPARRRMGLLIISSNQNNH